MAESAHPRSPDAIVSGQSLAELSPRRWHLAVAAACISAIYLFGVTDQWWPTPDSALYQQLGRSLIRGEGFRFNGHVNNEVTPGMPLIVGSLWALFGEGYWAPNLFVALCGLGSLAMAYATLGRWIGRGQAFVVVLATAACYQHYHYCHLILTDSTFALLFWCTAYACIRCVQGGWGWLAAAGALAGLAVFIRAPGATVLGPLAVGLLADRRLAVGGLRRIVAAAGLIGAVALTLGVFYALARSATDGTPPYLTGPAARAGLFWRLGQVAEAFFRLPGEMAIVITHLKFFGTFGVIPCVLALAGMIRSWSRNDRLATAFCAAYMLPSAFLVGAGTLRARYLMAFYPLIFLLILHGALWCAEEVCRWRSVAIRPAHHARAAILFLCVLLAINVPIFAFVAIPDARAGHAGRYHESIEGGRYVDLYPAADFLRKHFAGDAVIVGRWDRTRMLHYLSGRRVEPFLRTERWKHEHAQAVYDDLRRRGDFDAVLTDTGDLDGRYTRRLAELLDGAPDLEVVFRGTYVTIYRRVASPASAGSAPGRRQ